MYRRCSTLLLIVGFALIEADLFQDDGVLVEEQGTVRTISGLWTVMIVLHPPTRPNTTSWTDHLRLGIEKAGRQVTKEDKLMWLTRMAALRAKREVPWMCGPSTRRLLPPLAAGRVFGGVCLTSWGSWADPYSAQPRWTKYGHYELSSDITKKTKKSCATMSGRWSVWSTRPGATFARTARLTTSAG